MKAWRYSGTWLAAAGLALGGVGSGVALASVGDEERVYRQDALAHAGAVASAYRRLEERILLGSTAVTSWSGSVPPPTTGWLPLWTERGVRARYCDDTLLVYLKPAKLKGVGEDHRSVHVAPFAYVSDGNEGQFPALHWLEGNVAKGGAARPTVTLPPCMTAVDPLPPGGRAALAGRVKDPFAHIIDGVTHELRREDCSAGMHGPGRREAREIRQRENARGEATTDPAVYGPWELVADACRVDYAEWEHNTVECRWDAGPPHNREMVGEEVWRRLKTVTAGDPGAEPPQDLVVTTFGMPEFVSTSCWYAELAEVSHTPVISESFYQESRVVECGQGFTGTRSYSRTRTRRSTKFPWDEAPVVTVRYTSWRQASSSCEAEDDQVTPQECDPDIEECEGILECDPETDEDCGERLEADELLVGSEKVIVDVDTTRERECGLINPLWTGTYEETRTCRYELVLDEDEDESWELTSTTCGVWWMSEDNCALPPDDPLLRPESPGPPGTPGGGVCGPPGDGSASPADGDCPTPSAGQVASLQAQLGEMSVPGGGGGGGGGGCYLTTAVVEHRGIESDDGPTLTALRQFRDTYMMGTPLRRALVRLYYRLAPAIARDLEADSQAWEQIGGHIDSAVEALESGDTGKAFRAYWAASMRAFSLWAVFKCKRVFA